MSTVDGSQRGSRLGAGREAEVYAWGDDAVVKVYRPGFGGHQAEAAALSSLDGQRVAPRLIDVVSDDGRPGLVLERLPGSDMLALLQHRPWRLLHHAHTLARTHRLIHAVTAPVDLPDLREVLAHRIEEADLPTQLRGFASRILDRLPAGDQLCHGDYHPGNVLVAADEVRVIDWAGAARGVPAADHARTLLLLRWARPVPGTPLLARALLAAGRSLFARSYSRAYLRAAPAALPEVDSWVLVHAAARLSEGIDAERAALIGFLDRARRRADRRAATR